MGKEHELIIAAQAGNLVQIDKILGQRAKKSGPLQSIRKSVGPNCQDQNGYTPLHHASLNGRRDAVEALLKYEASTNIPDFAGPGDLKCKQCDYRDAFCSPARLIVCTPNSNEVCLVTKVRVGVDIRYFKDCRSEDVCYNTQDACLFRGNPECLAYGCCSTV